MKNKHRLFNCVIYVSVFVLIILILFVGDFWLHSKVKIDCFVYDPCGGCFADNIPCKPCKVVLEMEQFLYNKVDELGLREVSDISVYNTMNDTQKNLLNGRVQTEPEVEYPVLFVNDTALFGWNQINTGIDKLLLKTARVKPSFFVKANNLSNESFFQEQTKKPLAVYFKMEDCRSCKKTEEYLAGKDNFNGLCEILTYNLESADTMRLFEEYCKKYGVNSKTAGAPIIFIGDAALEGFEEIDTFLEVYIENGYGSKTCVIKAKNEK